MEHLDAIVRALEPVGIGLRVEGDRAYLDVDGLTLARPWRMVADGVAPEEGRGAIWLGQAMRHSDAKRVRQSGDWFADAHGNVYIRDQGVRVDIRGRRARESRDTETRAANLVSPRRAQVVLVLLAQPRLLRSSIRVLADAAGVSTAMAHSTLQLLEREGHVIHGVTTLKRRDELLDRWAAGFRTGLAPSITLGTFVGEARVDAWIDAGHQVHVSGEAAIDEIVGGSLTMYVDSIDPRAVARSRWRRPEPGEPPQIVVRRRFWDPDALGGVMSWSPVRRAPAELVYADLLSSGEARQREKAQEVREGLANRD